MDDRYNECGTTAPQVGVVQARVGDFNITEVLRSQARAKHEEAAQLDKLADAASYLSPDAATALWRLINRL